MYSVIFYKENNLTEVSPGTSMMVLEWMVHVVVLLTYSIVQSPSWEANWFSASQEIPRISRNPKVHYRTHKRPPPVSILGQPNPVHISTSNLLEIRPNIRSYITITIYQKLHIFIIRLRFPELNSLTCGG